MSELKELNDEELEQVTGGTGEGIPTRNVMVGYQDVTGGQVLYEDLGRYETAYAEEYGESIAKEWCIANNKIYFDYHIANLLTNNYKATELLETVTMTIKYPS